jgi:hypothetical protein
MGSVKFWFKWMGVWGMGQGEVYEFCVCGWVEKAGEGTGHDL